MPRKRNNIPENYNAPLPARLRTLMNDSGYTQADLAAHLGITRQSVSAYMDGSANPTPATIVSIATFLGVSTDYLLGMSTFQKAKIASLTATELGISEKSASILNVEKCQPNKSKLIILNYLIENTSLWEKITAYFSSAFAEKSHEKPFSLLSYNCQKADTRLFFADIIENLQHFKRNFYEQIIADNDSLEQMIFALISQCVDDTVAMQWCQLLYDSREKGDKDLQLEMIAKFLHFYGYSDYMHRLGCNLEQFIVSEATRRLD